MMWWEFVSVLVLIVLGIILIAPSTPSMAFGAILLVIGVGLGTQRAVEEWGK